MFDFLLRKKRYAKKILKKYFGDSLTTLTPAADELHRRSASVGEARYARGLRTSTFSFGLTS